MCAAVTVIFEMCKPVWLLELLVVTICVYKYSVNPITNPNPVYSHSYMWQYMYQICSLLVTKWSKVLTVFARLDAVIVGSNTT
jgi:hypothetical protein